MIQLPAHGCPFLCPWDLLLPIHLLTSHATNLMNLSSLEKLESWKNYRSCHNKATLILSCSSSTIHSRFSSPQLPHGLSGLLEGMTNNVMPEGSESLVILPFFRDGSFTSPVTVKTRQEFCNPIAATQLLIGCHAYFSLPHPPTHGQVQFLLLRW